jgi:hypothetical protein
LLKEAKDDHVLMDGAIREIVEKGDAIYQEYKNALTTFGAEPAALPEDSKGRGVSGLLNWILSEFKVLADILNLTSDNSAMISCESVFAILDRKGCQDL